MSLKQKFVKGMLGFALLFSVFQIGDVFEPIKSSALGANDDKVVPYYGIRNASEQPPLRISFTSKAPQYSYYTGNNPKNVFHEEYYMGRFLWYSIVPNQDATAWESYMARMQENLQKSLGTRQYEIDHYATHSSSYGFRYNLKKGSTDPFKHWIVYNGDDTGTKPVSYGDFRGKNYEWRYLGYSNDGVPISNPYFPADYPSSDNSDEYWKKRNWIIESWYDGYANFTYTWWDTKYKEKKLEWFEKYLKPAHPGLFDSTRTVEWWADRLSMRNNADWSTGIAEGWHRTSGGRQFYVVFVMESPKRPNLRLTDFVIRDKETNEYMGGIGRDANNPYSFVEYLGNNKQYIDKGKTYVISGTVKNMKYDGMEPHDTTYKPVNLQLYVNYDESTQEMGTPDEVYTCPATPATDTIKYGESHNFKCEFTIPELYFQDIEIGLRIPVGFYEAGDNTVKEDDQSALPFKPTPKDMALTKIEFLDYNGNVTDDVIPNETYSVRYYVSRPYGNTPVQNTTINATFSDKGTVSRNQRVVATEVLEKGKTIAITVENAITPRTNVIEACGTIDFSHAINGDNLLNGNDTKCETIQSDINISVKDFKIKPQSLFLPPGMSRSYQNVTMEFFVTNYNVQNMAKNIPYVIRKGGVTVASGIIPNVPANTPIPWAVTLNNVPISAGTHEFTVEVNPSPRMWFESVKGVSNPYLDNVATNAIYAHQTPATVKCDVDNPRNDWQTTYYSYQWWGHTECSTDEDGNTSCWCVTDYTETTYPTHYYYEEYKVQNVFFRSKLTQDKFGGDGWIDLKSSAYRNEGKVKAGYGFEMKITTTFRTNINTAPKSWSSGCSGRYVSPSDGATVNAPTRITVTMPFDDLYGNPVKYTLNAHSISGSWYNETQQYQFPMRDAFGLKNTREIFVNERARDGKYSIKIETDGTFYGSYDKPYSWSYWGALCDIEYVDIQILGANSDDLKSHIIQ